MLKQFICPEKGKYSLTGLDWDKISNEAKNLIKRMLTYKNTKFQMRKNFQQKKERKK